MNAYSTDIDVVHDYQPCWEPDDVARAVAGLGRLSQVGQTSAQRRRNERKGCNALVQIAHARKLRLPDGSRAVLHAVARNLSRSGAGLLLPLFFEPAVPESKLPMLRSSEIIGEGTQLEIGLRNSLGGLMWVQSTVVRARVVRHDFLDVGVRFNRRGKVEALYLG